MRAQGWRRFGWYVRDQGPGLPGDWNGRLAPSHAFIFHFNRLPRKPNKTVESKHAGETLGGGGLRGADGRVHRKTGYGNAIQSHRIPDSVFRIMRHKGGLGAAARWNWIRPIATSPCGGGRWRRGGKRTAWSWRRKPGNRRGSQGNGHDPVAPHVAARRHHQCRAGIRAGGGHTDRGVPLVWPAPAPWRQPCAGRDLHRDLADPGLRPAQAVRALAAFRTPAPAERRRCGECRIFGAFLR